MSSDEKSAVDRAGYAALDEKIEVEARGEESIRNDLLLVFPFEHTSREPEIQIHTEEFTALCPWSGLPDLGSLRIEYVPDRVLLELKSLKYYLLSFRQVGIAQEHAACRILDDLLRAISPRRMTVTLEYRARGGIVTTVTVRHPES
ncbi:MAG: NADPH-dependent 7-cyano-7-deazaguanine reductase QueF [Deltaproteobacteria bacterium]|nr:NADPH-dependent 7-cyano-7-deazaguanine reductase QueF [Deltaproteobacteria bacterium]